MELHAGLLGKSNIQYWAGKYPVDDDICMENLVPVSTAPSADNSPDAETQRADRRRHA